MTKKLFTLVAIVLVASMALSACAPAATPAPVEPAPVEPAPVEPTAVPVVEPTAVPPVEVPAVEATKVCMVTDSGGIGDKSFNDLAWKGVQQGMTDFGVEGNYIQSTQPSDFASNLTACKDSGAKLIVGVGFMMADDFKAAATANPDIYYAGVDMGGFDLPNFRGVGAAMEQSTALAGYVAAGMSQTHKLGWYVGFMFPAVQSFGDGWYYGMKAYDAAHSTTTESLGFDPVAGTYTGTGSWIDAAKGTELGNSMMDEDVDIILPVCGGVGAATAAVMQQRGSGYIIGVDQDWTQTYPQYSGQILVSVTKQINVHIFDAITRVETNTWEGGDYILTLENGGTDLTYNPAITIPDDLKAEVEAMKAKIISGEIVVPISTPMQ